MSYRQVQDLGDNGSTSFTSLRKYICTDVDEDRSTVPLCAYCFMTGFMDVICFSAVFVWCAFQTGNTIQLSLALARLFNGQHDYSFQLADQLALCSLIAFIIGAFIGRIGDKIGCKTRAWLSLGTFIQTLFTMVAAIAFWTNALSFVCVGFMSASMGLQAIMGKRTNTQFATTVVLTSTWCELVADPKFFEFRHIVVSRDYKVLAIGSLFLGGFCGRALLDAVGFAGALGVATGVRFIISIWWLFVPAKDLKP